MSDNLGDSLVFLVASPRSGTKILRDTLGNHSRIDTSMKPLEELWTFGQENQKLHEYHPKSLTPEITHHLREAFDRLQTQGNYFLEKNVFNSLRIPYIRAVFPEAYFIQIVRDGRDVTASLRDYRKTPIDWDYYLSQKLLKINPFDLIKVGGRNVIRSLKRLLKRDDQVKGMGPFFEGYFDLVNSVSPLKLSSTQWERCVKAINLASQNLKSTNYHELYYEDLISNPSQTLSSVAEFLDLKDPNPMIQFARKNYREKNIGKWKRELTVKEYLIIESTIGPTLTKYGYNQERISTEEDDYH